MYCDKCGKYLEEGEVCDCTQQTNMAEEKDMKFKFKGIGSPSYNRMANFLASPIIMVYGIALMILALYNFFTQIGYSGNFQNALTVLITFSIYGLLSISLISIFFSARNYLSKKVPISSMFLSIAAGVMIALVVIFAIATIIVCISYAKLYYVSRNPGLGFILIIFFTISYLAISIVCLIQIRNSFIGVRHMISNTGKPHRISLFAPVAMTIALAIRVIEFFFSVLLPEEYTKFQIYLISLMPGFSQFGSVSSPFGNSSLDLYNNASYKTLSISPYYLLIQIISLCLSALPIIILFKAREAQIQASEMQD